MALHPGETTACVSTSQGYVGVLVDQVNPTYRQAVMDMIPAEEDLLMLDENVRSIMGWRKQYILFLSTVTGDQEVDSPPTYGGKDREPPLSSLPPTSPPSWQPRFSLFKSKLESSKEKSLNKGEAPRSSNKLNPCVNKLPYVKEQTGEETNTNVVTHVKEQLKPRPVTPPIVADPRDDRGEEEEASGASGGEEEGMLL